MRRTGALLLLAALAAAQEPRLVAQLGHGGSTGVRFTPDGKHVLVTGYGRESVLYDRASGLELRRFRGHNSWVLDADVHGVRAVTCGADETARLWDLATGKELRRFLGHKDNVWAVAFTPDGKQVITAGMDATARLWDIASGQEVRRFKHGGSVEAVVLHPKGDRFLTGCANNSAVLWSKAGKRLQTFQGHTDRVEAVAFARDGRVLTGARDNVVMLWTTRGRVVRRFAHKSPVRAIACSNDGKRIATGTEAKTAHVWDLKTGAEITKLDGHPAEVLAVAFTSDDRELLTGGGPAVLWDLATAAEIRRYDGLAEAIQPIALSPAGDRLVGGCDRDAVLWDLREGREVRRLRGHSSWISGVDFSPDGRFVLTGSYDHTAILWNRITGEAIRTYPSPDKNHIALTRFLPPGEQFLIYSFGETRGVRVILIDRETGGEVRRWDDASFHFASTKDGRGVLVGEGNDAVLWDLRREREEQRFHGHEAPVFVVAISPDGRRVMTGARDNTVRLWDRDTGKELVSYRFEAHGVACVFTPDGSRALAVAQDGDAVFLEPETGNLVRRYRLDQGGVMYAFSNDARFLFSAFDSSVTVREVATGATVCRLISFLDGTWAAVDPIGRYDASRGGNVRGLHWAVGDEIVELDQLKQRYYEPRLLAKVLGFNKEPLREVVRFTKAELPPRMEIDPPTPRAPRLRLRLKNRGAGIGRVAVKINGKEIAADARAPGADPDAKEAQVVVPLAGDRRLKPGEVNRIEVRVFNGAGYLSTRGIALDYKAPGKKRTAPPELWAVVAGVADYEGKKLRLRYAAKDAADLAAALKTAGSRLFQARRVHLQLLESPDKKTLVAALKRLNASRPGDVLFVYLAGHGKNHQGGFFFLTREARSADLTDPAVRAQVALSSDELTELINKAPAAEKQVLILDTCASGRFIDNLTETREVPSSQIRALQRLKDRTGVHILAGCAADRVSYEASRYGQGLLTYSLLLGMRGGALKEDELVDVATLFHFAADRVPQLAERIGGIQRPVIATPKASQSFAIGRLTPADRKKIPLRPALPLFLRSNFQDEERVEDHLELAAAVDQRLRGESARLAFLDVRTFPDALRIGGRYRVAGDEVVVKARLFRPGADPEPFTVTGKQANLAALAKKLVGRALRGLK